VILLFNGELYPLLKFHFHSRSEHQVNGASWPFEMHMVHGQSAQGPFIVLAIFAEQAEGKHDADSFFSELAEQFTDNNQTDNSSITINPYRLLPENQTHYYRYEGSLTTHHNTPNTENVSWVIYKNPLSVNAETLRRFAALLHGSRTVQDLNRRFVLFNTGSCCCDNSLKSGDT
jgi:Carbonic anhydrase